MRLTRILTFPVKSCAPVQAPSAAVEARGLAGDRRWMVIDAEGRFLTARSHPTLVLVTVEPREDGLVLRAPHMSPLSVPIPAGNEIPVRIWKDEVSASAADDPAHAWFSEYLGMPVRLVFQQRDQIRSIAGRPGARSGDRVSFADGYPLLLIGTASLADLNRRLDVPVSMLRFRPNLVVETDLPFAEDDWQSIVVGDVLFDVAKRCSRCVLTTVDPETGIRNGDGEPLRTLRKYRTVNDPKGIYFGVNLIPRRSGVLALDMPVAEVQKESGDER